MFRRTVTIRFDEADARGVLFYGRVQALAHRVFEDFVVSELVETRREKEFEALSRIEATIFSGVSSAPLFSICDHLPVHSLPRRANISRPAAAGGEEGSDSEYGEY